MTIVRLFLILGTLLGGLAVAGGAFASHALKETLSERALVIFETGVRYQMYHALGLVLIGLWLSQAQTGQGLITSAGVAFGLGILMFSGSLYGLSLSGIKWLGPITPLGGVALLVGWGCLVIAAFRF